jgi:hypothetical protein
LQRSRETNLLLIKQDGYSDDNNNDNYSSDDTIYSTTETYDKENRKKSLSEQLIEENDEYMDDIIAGLHKQ